MQSLKNKSLENKSLENKSLENKIKDIVRSKLGKSELSEVVEYAMFPAGKLFRPKLCLALAADAGEPGPDHYLLAAAVEAHHAYSLAHDDMPCMDDDSFRRGKPSTHVRFGEWKALLAGDALLNLSYELLADMGHPKAKNIIAMFARMTGAQGLILGQYIDLSGQNKELSETLYMHELKTGRLIQFALAASALLSGAPMGEESALELGKSMGINFQLLDDLGELVDEARGHEENVNAFLNGQAPESLKLVDSYNSAVFDILRAHGLRELESMYAKFLGKTRDKILPGLKAVCGQSGLSENAVREIFSRAL